MRTFIAIALPERITKLLGGIQEELKKSQADVKWVETPNIHLTLKFLGELNPEQIGQVSAALAQAGNKIRPFEASLGELGAFPSLRYPRVIWLGVEKGNQNIKELAALVEDSLFKIAIPREDKPFSSHITLGRTRSSLNNLRLSAALSNAGGIYKAENPEFHVGRITLFKSTLTPKGPLYESLAETILTAT
ncbi:MAG: RNA 2',3'-cyclic phosphodiesterase [Candidatus Omnitrophica bacterium]|nr:RNA 2',3'-cyclic phosphodiesterase [Candidatus Omnitrophota bacterium]